MLAAANSMTVGVTYRFTLQAENQYGFSGFSEEIRAALGSLPDKPDPPVKIELKSTETSIALEWPLLVPSDAVPITGYYLYMDDGYNGDFVNIYNGKGFPTINTYT